VQIILSGWSATFTLGLLPACPLSSTLISGKHDAVLVDTAITVDQIQKLVDWIAHSGKNLTAIYATHGHGDHFFGVNTIQKKFPKARFVATSEVIAVMRKQASVPVVESYWKPCMSWTHVDAGSTPATRTISLT
jgi:glyoxylase-like metal-dependent hydrolase (beta-lactamase superfamily II)